MFVDSVADNDEVDDGELVVLTHSEMPDGIELTAPSIVSFSASGLLTNPAVDDVEFQLCDARGDQDTGGGIAAGRRIELSATGWPRVLSQVDQVACET